MSPLEERGRQLIVELADFIREASVPEAMEHLNAITALVRAKVFEAEIIGEGNIIIDQRLIFGQPVEEAPLQSVFAALADRRTARQGRVERVLAGT